jgi:methyl-accepting chemotaxis protein
MQEIIGNIRGMSAKASLTGTQIASATTESSASLVEIRANIEHMKQKLQILDSTASSSSISVHDFEGFIHKISSLIEDEHHILETAARGIEDMVHNFDELQKMTSERLSIVENLEKTSSEGLREMENTQTLIQTVVDKTSVISNMVGVIKSIASQTNLLAMNAAIEAAHAGDSGRGFAVVAAEIRALAESSAVSSRQISDSLKSVISSIQLTGESTHRTSDFFKRIVAGIESVGLIMNELSTRSLELSASGNAVRSDLQKLVSATETVQMASREIETQLDPLKSGVDMVGDIASDSFRGMEEITVGVNDIASSSSMIAEEGQQNAETIRQLVDIVGRFKFLEEADEKTG